MLQPSHGLSCFMVISRIEQPLETRQFLRDINQAQLWVSLTHSKVVCYARLFLQIKKFQGRTYGL